jgi:hypothetical protein
VVRHRNRLSTLSGTRAGRASPPRWGPRDTSRCEPTASGFPRLRRPTARGCGSPRRLHPPVTSPPPTASSSQRRWRRPRGEPPHAPCRPTARPDTASPGRRRTTLGPCRRPTVPRGSASPPHRRSPPTDPPRRPPAPRGPPSRGRPGPPPIGPCGRPKAPPDSTSPCRHRSRPPGPCRHPMVSRDPARRRHRRRPPGPRCSLTPRPYPALREARRISPSGPCRRLTDDPDPASRHRRRPFPVARPAMAAPPPALAGTTPTEHAIRALRPIPATRPAGGDHFPSRRSHRRNAPPRTAPSAAWRRSASIRTTRPRSGRLRHLRAPPRISPLNG